VASAALPNTVRIKTMYYGQAGGLRFQQKKYYFDTLTKATTMKKLSSLLFAFILSCPALFAKGDDDSTKIMVDQMMEYLRLKDSVTKAMKYRSGLIPLPAGIVSLNVPAGFKYLGTEQSKYVVEELWGNLPQENLQGMLFPENSDPFDDSSYAYIITYSASGHVKDGDAKDIDYDDLMKDMKADDAEENKKRKLMGSPGLYTEGWAAKPYYDDNKKVLHWALDLRSEGADEHTLNYKIISLGRKGMLTMNAIAGINQLSVVKADVDKVINMAQYTEGNTYKDFDSNVDEVAAYTVGGLVAGKVLLKIGFFAKFWKLILLGVAAIGAWLVKMFKKKKEPEVILNTEQGTRNEEV
jgi:uncharacterized membrane-anchored protein